MYALLLSSPFGFRAFCTGRIERRSDVCIVRPGEAGTAAPECVEPKSAEVVCRCHWGMEPELTDDRCAGFVVLLVRTIIA